MVLRAGSWVVTFEVLAITVGFLLSVLVLCGCLTILILPHDEPSLQAAVAIATAVVTAWITALGGQAVLRR